ncbi:hypothetical protein E2562_022279 [Oryza meyeriana var. granulata]|uniref:Uncharacterized protein n=1 Tax=Oryza meyeriana var. granulata TaxID=110450 RepID=A0A6G1D4V8_9ORYZ|nr:hypothetical protein E2562_022279 [Oryza meyeriana var. granulata]
MATTSPPAQAQAAALPLSGRVAIVTGASGPAEALAAELPSAVAVKADVSDEAGVRSLFDAAESACGGGAAHILVACAGHAVSTIPTLAATSAADFDATFAVNTRGAFLCLREAANRLRRCGGGRIVAVSSTLAVTLRPGYGAYAGSKAAVEAMVRVMAKEAGASRTRG